jgi:hypothetical protein
MRKAFIFFVFVFFLSCQKNDNGLSDDCLNEKVDANNKIKGGSLLQTYSLFDSTVSLPEDIIKTTDLAQKTNANWVSLSPIICLQERGGNINGSPYSFRVSDEIDKMKVIIPKMENSGLQNIMLKPNTCFWEVNGSSFWGDFYVTNEQEWRYVEIAYEELVYEFAKLSIEFPNVKLLCVGNELKQFATRRPQFFKSLIAKIRTDFPVLKLTYAANWDEYQSIAFWGDLDYIGVNPYFSLVNKKTATVNEVEIAFLPIKSKLKELSCTYQKPILFTEYGFRSIDYATWQPWTLGDVQLDYKVNFAAQENAYAAFYNVFWEESWLAGGFFWEWDILSNGEINKENDNGWYVRDKPVEKIIKERYSR